jgi:outer membrane protein OmpA-like peptidoglycan-associated protein
LVSVEETVKIRVLTLVSLSVVAAITVSRPSYGEPHPDAAVTEVEVNPYHLTPSGLVPGAVGTSETLGHLEWHVGAIGVHLVRPLIVVSDDNSPVRSLVSQRQELDLSVAVGLIDWAEVGLVLPLIVGQKGQLPGRGLGAAADSGFGNAIIHIQSILLDSESYPVGLSLAVPVTLATRDANGYFGARTASAAPTIHASQRFAALHIGLMGGVRFQGETRLANWVDTDQLLFGAAVNLAFDESVDLTVELDGATGLLTTFEEGASTRAELVAALRVKRGANVELLTGYGTGVLRGAGAPLHRLFLGVGFRLGGGPVDPCDIDEDEWSGVAPTVCPDLDFDGDGLKNGRDGCPREAEDIDGFEDDDGCLDGDNDADQLLDSDDACPLEPEDSEGFEDEDGCPDPDNDQDGILDVDDECPNLAETVNGFSDSDGCPDEDGDGDGIEDALDKCQENAEDIDEFEDEDGCPDPDNDQDGVLDADDRCPLQAENIDGVDDEDGCPEDQPVAVITEDKIEINQRILFETNRAVLIDESFPILNAVLALLRKHPEVRIRVEGHTDGRGSDAENLALSEQRSQAVVDYLVGAAGAELDLSERLESKGYGEMKPIESNLTQVGRDSNRRVEFTIMSALSSDSSAKD